MALVVVGSGLVQPQGGPTTIRWCCVTDCGALHASMVESGLSQAADEGDGTAWGAASSSGAAYDAAHRDVTVSPAVKAWFGRSTEPSLAFISACGSGADRRPAALLLLETNQGG